MVRKFKLIKKYPKSLSLGSVVTTTDIPPDDIKGCKYIEDTKNTRKVGFKKEEVENYPEFWQEIKEYPKILEVRNYDKGFISGYASATLRANDRYLNSDNQYELGLYSLDDVFKNGFHIYKVQTANGEVFTIGDKTKEGTICSFNYDVEDKNIGYKIEEDYKHNWAIEFAEKAKSPLFTTEDGKEIFKNDKFWFVKNFKIEVYHADECWTPKVDGLEFSSVEAADKWIDENKPRFSKKDIREAIEFAKRNLSECTIIPEDELKQKLGV